MVFNPATVKDNATYERPHQYPTGIEYVVVNGVPVLDPKGLTGARPGRPLYGPARTAMSAFDSRLAGPSLIGSRRAAVVMAPMLALALIGPRWSPPRKAARAASRARAS